MIDQLQVDVSEAETAPELQPRGRVRCSPQPKVFGLDEHFLGVWTQMLVADGDLQCMGSASRRGEVAYAAAIGFHATDSQVTVQDRRASAVAVSPLSRNCSFAHNAAKRTGPRSIRIQRCMRAFSAETVQLKVAKDRNAAVVGCRTLRCDSRSATAFTFELARQRIRLQRPILHTTEIMTTTVQSTSSCVETPTVVVGGLARLTPMNLMPERFSRHMQTVTKLKQLRSVLVSSASKCSYTIDVFTPSHSVSRIPTSLKAAAKGQQPDAHIAKQFTDFVSLRNELYETCKASHPTMDCPFCNEVARTLLLGAVLPGSVLSLVLSQHQQTKAVQRFLDSLLLLAAACPVIDADACRCQEQLPRQLFKFLFGDSDPLA